MPRDGCRECLYRRIRCDKTDPSCQKCIKKGIKCSGVGKFCFVDGVTRRKRRVAAPPTASKAVTSSPLMPHADNRLEVNTNSDHTSIERKSSDSSPHKSELELSVSAGRTSVWPGACNVRTDLALEGLKPGISELLMNCKFCKFSHCEMFSNSKRSSL